MNTTLFAGAVLAASLAGCATVQTGDQVWFKEGATPREQEAALASAQAQATQAHTTADQERDIVIRSMTAQGWRLMPKHSAPPLKAEATRKAPTPMKQSTAIP